MHEVRNSNLSILSDEPESIDVDNIMVHRHRKPGKPDSLRVQYRCGKTTFREWVCPDHGGMAAEKARRWWMRRFGTKGELWFNVDNAMKHHELLAERLNDMTKTITVVREGKYWRIVGYEIDKREE